MAGIVNCDADYRLSPKGMAYLAEQYRRTANARRLIIQAILAVPDTPPSQWTEDFRRLVRQYLADTPSFERPFHAGDIMFVRVGKEKQKVIGAPDRLPPARAEQEAQEESHEANHPGRPVRRSSVLRGHRHPVVADRVRQPRKPAGAAARAG